MHAVETDERARSTPTGGGVHGAIDSHSAPAAATRPRARWPKAPPSPPSAAQFRLGAGRRLARCERRAGARPPGGVAERAATVRALIVELLELAADAADGDAARLHFEARVVNDAEGSAVHQNFALGDAAATPGWPAPPAAPPALRGVQSLAEGARLHVWLAVGASRGWAPTWSSRSADRSPTPPPRAWRRPRTSICSARSSAAGGARLELVWRRRGDLKSEIHTFYTERKLTASRRTRGRRSGSRSTGG